LGEPIKNCNGWVFFGSFQASNVASIHISIRCESFLGQVPLNSQSPVAQNSSMMVRRELRRTGSLPFALHDPIVPDCMGQFRNTVTTGRPIFYMVAELDDLTPAKPCLEYVDRMRAAGNPNVSIKVYPGQYHA
jgi:hypothetical protein